MTDKQLWTGVVIILIAFVGFIFFQKNKPGPYDAFAQCLTEHGVKEYGAYWCPNCQEQKKEFGNSFEYVNYEECALPGGSGQTQECTAAGIESYPTWEFADGSRRTGLQSLRQLAIKSGCELDGTYNDPNAEAVEELPEQASSTPAAAE